MNTKFRNGFLRNLIHTSISFEKSKISCVIRENFNPEKGQMATAI